MAKSRNGGIAGTGVFGFLGTTIGCDSKDESLYCTFMKIVNLLLTIAALIYVAYLGYNYIK